MIEALAKKRCTQRHCPGSQSDQRLVIVVDNCDRLDTVVTGASVMWRRPAPLSTGSCPSYQQNQNGNQHLPSIAWWNKLSTSPMSAGNRLRRRETSRRASSSTPAAL